MTAPEPPDPTRQPPTPSSWANVVLPDGDPEAAHIDEMERRAAPLPAVATVIRELITRFEICHFKADRHVRRIIDAIGTMRLDLAPALIGQAHPRRGETAWRNDPTGRSRRGQEFIWALQLWLTEAPYSDDDPRGIPRPLIEQVNRALGDRDASKLRLVSALLARLVLNPDREPLPPKLAAFWEQVEATDICHYSFPANLQGMIEAIGRLEPVQNFVGCGSCDAERRSMAQERFDELCAWLRGEPGKLDAQLGNRSPVKAWLVACLAKTLKEHAGLHETMPFA